MVKKFVDDHRYQKCSGCGKVKAMSGVPLQAIEVEKDGKKTKELMVLPNPKRRNIKETYTCRKCRHDKAVVRAGKKPYPHKAKRGVVRPGTLAGMTPVEQGKPDGVPPSPKFKKVMKKGGK